MEATMRRIFLVFTLCIISPFVEPVAGQEVLVSSISLEFVEFCEVTPDDSGTPATVGVFRMKNNTPEKIRFMAYRDAPDLIVQRFVDNEWQPFSCNWCGLGKRARELHAAETEYFFVNPEYYRIKYGEKVRFGFFFPDGDPDTPSFTWTEMLELPNVDNHDDLPACRFFTPKPKGSQKVAPNHK